MKVLPVIAALTVVGATVIVAVGCASVDDTAVSTVNCGDFESFRPVSLVLEQRCGTLDCHGTFARPFRIFSRTGLRQPKLASEFDAGDYAEYYPGGEEEVTNDELLANFRSMCGLEPELTTQVVAGDLPPEGLTLVRKQRLLEKHKGGKIFNPNQQGDACIVTWLTKAPGTPFNQTPCDVELSHD